MSKVLVIGGTGFIGRHFVKYLVDYKICEVVYVIDKRPPFMANLDSTFTPVFKSEMVKFIHFDVSKRWPPAEVLPPCDIVINLASNSDPTAAKEIIGVHVKELRINCAQKAFEMGTQKYVEVSTATIYDPKDEKGSKPAKEGDTEKPSNHISSCHLEAEQWILKNLPELPVVIVRLPLVYGPGDVHGLMRRLVCAASYLESEDKEMQLLYSDDLRLHTLHVQDAVGGIWHLICSGENREVYNLVDDNDTTQKKLNQIYEQLFAIKCTCVGHTKTKLALKAGVEVEEALEEANEEHAENWAKLCKKTGTEMGPLLTAVHIDEVSGRAISIDNSKSKAAGYAYTVPNVTAEYVKHAISYWQDGNYGNDAAPKTFFPKVVR